MKYFYFTFLFFVNYISENADNLTEKERRREEFISSYQSQYKPGSVLAKVSVGYLADEHVTVTDETTGDEISEERPFVRSR